MASTTDLQRVKGRAEETDRILAGLQLQIEAIRKAAVKQAGLGEEEKLLKENEELKNEIESLKKAMAVAEIANGVRQASMPSKGTLAEMLTQASNAQVNGGLETSTQGSRGKPEATGDKKTKHREADIAAPGAKKAKTDKQEEDKEEKDAKSEKGAKQNKGGKGEGDGKGKKAASSAGGDSANAPVDFSRLDMRVGKIVAVEKHPDADGLYVEQVDLGEGKTRTVVSGLVKHIPINAMRGRIAVFMCNLKPAKVRGILSEGMIMCAVGPEKTEILVPPTESVEGDRVLVEEYPGTPDGQLNPKKKIWETLKPDVRTNGDRVATFKGAALMIPGKGPVVAPTLTDSQIS